MTEWFSAPFVSPARTERLNVDSLDGETAAEVWGRGVTSGGERREAPLLIDRYISSSVQF